MAYETSFNSDPFVFEMFTDLVKSRKITSIVETGTYHGHTTDALASLVPKVYTIEIRTDFQDIAKKNCQNKNIDFMLGSSVEVLPKILPALNDNTLFFLDAHWNEYCPLWDEIRLIGERGIKPVIVVHDFKVPEIPELGFDHWNGLDISHANLQKVIEGVYGVNGYTHYTNTKIIGSKRGAGFYVPKKV